MNAGHTGTGHRRVASRLVPLAAATAAVVVLLTGCGSGQVSQTADQVSAVDGAHGQVGTIDIRNAQLAPPTNGRGFYPTGSDAPLEVTIVNTGAVDDRLASVSSPDVVGVQVRGDTNLPAGTALRAIQQALPAGEQPPSAPVSAVSTPAPGKVGGSAPPQQAAPAMQLGQIAIVLTGLKTVDLYTGYTIPVVFTFARAGAVTVNVPVGSPGAGAARD